MHQILRLWLLIVVPLLVCSAAAAATIEVPLTPQEIQLRGLDAEAQFVVTIDAPKDREGAPLLVINWRTSGLIDTRQSTVAIAVNGKTRRSVWLADLQKNEKNELTIPLGGLTGGKHSISVKTSLQVSDDDRCLQRHRDNAWFSIQPESRIVWERGVSAPKRSPIREYPAKWSRLANGPTGIVLQIDAETDKASLGAYLDANHLLRRWAYEPQRTSSDITVGTLRLQTIDRLPSTSRAVKRLEQRPDARFVIMIDSPGTVAVVGRDTNALREAILMFGNDQARALCLTSLCTAGAQTTKSTEQTEAQPTFNPAEVWRLGTSGQPNGWTARGEGEHQMRFVWQKPSIWQIQNWPVLQLHAKATGSKAVDPTHSAITVRINNRPIATYSLASWQQSNKAQIRIPKELWDEPEWVFDILVYTKPADAQLCSASDQRGMWFTVSPETKLVVPHQSEIFEGIASFYAETTDILELPLYIDVSQDDPIAVERVFASAGALYPFIQRQDESRDPDSPQRVWELVDESQCLDRRCIQVLKKLPTSSPLQYTPTFWKDASGTLEVPHVQTDGTLALHYREKSPEQPEQLIVVPGPTADSTVEPPDYSGLVGHIALFAESWHILDIRESTGDGPMVPGVPIAPPQVVENASVEQDQLRWLNFVWAALSLLIVAWVLVRLWRKPKDKEIDENWEIHDK